MGQALVRAYKESAQYTSAYQFYEVGSQVWNWISAAQGKQGGHRGLRELWHPTRKEVRVAQEDAERERRNVRDLEEQALKHRRKAGELGYAPGEVDKQGAREELERAKAIERRLPAARDAADAARDRARNVEELYERTKAKQ